MTKTFRQAWITGASSGIGAALAHRLASHGIPLVLIARNQARLEEVAKSLHSLVPVQLRVVDLADSRARAALVTELSASPPDLLINNAGLGTYGSVLTRELADHLQPLEVNVTALTELTIACGRALSATGRRGIICNVSSAAAFQAFPSCAVYAATKAYVNSFSEAVDAELAPIGVRVLTSCPGQVATQFSSRASGKGERDDAPRAYSMTASFAAEEIWRQIQKEDSLRIFDWRYRCGVFLSRFVLPKSWVHRVLRGNIEKRVPDPSYKES
ncbi:MAG: SDR family NAD(P)-dependent oxidoreductase [Chlamydiia bacterium]|nr:SDR family NAD(P)-dependent oxidoreductase [Chlamydiia bacterium]